MMKQPLLLLTTGYETSQLTRFETIFNKYFNKLLSTTKSSAKSNDITTLFTAEKLAMVFNKLEIYSIRIVFFVLNCKYNDIY